MNVIISVPVRFWQGGDSAVLSIQKTQNLFTMEEKVLSSPVKTTRMVAFFLYSFFI